MLHANVRIESETRIIEVDVVENLASRGGYHQDTSSAAAKCRRTMAKSKPITTLYACVDCFHLGPTEEHPRQSSLWCRDIKQREVNMQLLVSNIEVVVYGLLTCSDEQYQYVSQGTGHHQTLDTSRGWSTLWLRGSSNGAVTTSDTIKYRSFSEVHHYFRELTKNFSEV
eukprot:SAG31_NODE_9068_length_1340_cov_1.614021_2_plen_169_part_00